MAQDVIQLTMLDRNHKQLTVVTLTHVEECGIRNVYRHKFLASKIWRKVAKVSAVVETFKRQPTNQTTQWCFESFWCQKLARTFMMHQTVDARNSCKFLVQVSLTRFLSVCYRY